MSEVATNGTMIQFGDVVEVGFLNPALGRREWSEPGVVVTFSSRELGVCTILDDDEGDRKLLTTIGTVYHPVRHVPGTARWTVEAVTKAIVDAHIRIPEDKDEVTRQRHLEAYGKTAAILLQGFSEDAAKPPVFYMPSRK